MVSRLALTIPAIWLAACSVGEVPVGGGSNPPGVDANSAAAEEAFNATVAPLIAEKGCTVGATCHGGVQIPLLSQYSLLTDRYKLKPSASNILVIKGSLTGGIHPTTPTQVPYFDEAQIATIAAWVDAHGI